jgi:hypothetical protein
MRFYRFISPDPASAITDTIRAGAIPACLTFRTDGTVEVLAFAYHAFYA